jgi:tricorn protease
MLPLSLLAAFVTQDPAFDAGDAPLLMHNPTISAELIVFQFAGDLWKVSRSGGAAIRLTTSPGVESNPYFSPDGEWVAFSGQYDGNRDVYVIPVEGGNPKRLTAHPAAEETLGWTPDGKSVLFTSEMNADTSYERLFTVSASGGFPKQLPFPAGVQGSFSPDGKQIAYVPNGKWQQAWKRYRGGQTTPIWIAQLSDSKWKAIPRKNTNDESPIWVGDAIYYRSDHKGIFGLYRYDLKTGRTTEEVPPSGFDIKSASAGAGSIVYERLGSIHVFDIASKRTSKVPITISGEFPESRTQFKELSRFVSGTTISPTGQRVVLSARGHIFSVPASKGDSRMLSDGTIATRTFPSWSPNGKFIAYITDQNKVQQLGLLDLATNQTRTLDLGEDIVVRSKPRWSPDSTKVTYTDHKNSLWVLDIATGKNTKIDTGSYRSQGALAAKWSPDSKWLTYVRDLPTLYKVVCIYNVVSGEKHQLTDGMAHAESPTFDRDGKHLYFLASTDIGQGIDPQDISAYISPNYTSSVYAIVLKKDRPNPLFPESDEEPIKDGPPTGKSETSKGPVPDVIIDVADIERRIITLPFPRQIYEVLEAGPSGSVFAISSPARPTATDSGGPGTLHKFDFSSRKVSQIAEGISRIEVSEDGSKMLLQAGGLSIVPTSGPINLGAGRVNTAGLMAKIDPVREWEHIFDESIRMQKRLFYAPNLHGIDLDAISQRYRPFLPHLKSRADLNYLLIDMMGELCVGHMFIGGGDIPSAGNPSVRIGLLGADFTFENGRYRLTRVYDGERWNPDLYGPLAQPGVLAKAGEYILAIDGKELTDSTDIYEALENKAGKQVKVRLGPNADGSGSREVTVVPVASESSLRIAAWVEDNRRRVDQATNGRGAYIFVPDTNVGGWTYFTRYFYSQLGRDGAVVDGRHNGGGAINDFMVRELNKPLDFFSATRYGMNYSIPPTGIYGPKVMIINEMAGSGGDIFPYLFRQHKTGTIVGKRTWGAMITNYSFNVIDGGRISSPDDAMFNVETGQWIIENEGNPPDVDVELDPYLWRQGKDAQLEKAIEILNRELSAYKPKRPKTPPYPDWSKLKPPSK